jgi:inosine/xanthosine triphosphatase
MNRVCVVSKNPVKVEAVELGFEKMFGKSEFFFLGLSASSDVKDQPLSDAETKLGARNRVSNAQKLYADYDYYVALEGGVEKDSESGYYNCFAYVCISHKGMTTFARSGTFTLPKQVGILLDEGKELGEADDIVFNRTNSKQANGAIGILTHDYITRSTFYAEMVVLGLIPYKNIELYQ